jgi:hypothetical protein
MCLQAAELQTTLLPSGSTTLLLLLAAATATVAVADAAAVGCSDPIPANPGHDSARRTAFHQNRTTFTLPLVTRFLPARSLRVQPD